MDARIIARRASASGPVRASLHAVALAAGCCWVAGCMGGPGHEPVDGGPRDGGPRDAAPDNPDASPAPRFVQIAYTTAPNPKRHDAFGSSVALEGDILAVGMPGEDSAARGIDGDEDDDRALDAGAVYVFRRSDTGWEKEAYLKASNARVAGDNFVSHHHGFGAQVALSGDTIAVSAPNESGGARGINGDQESEDAPGSGAVYVFRRGDAGWHQEAYLKASDAHTGQGFGAQALALDGDTLAVLAAVPPVEGGLDYDIQDSIGIQCARERGRDRVYVFRRSGTSWKEEASFPLPAEFWYNIWSEPLGGAMALSGDTLAIGTPSTRWDTGAVYVFQRSGTGWTQQAELTASNADDSDLFGVSVALEGDVLAVGAPQAESTATGIDGDQADTSGYQSGAVYVFRRSEAGWQQEAYVKASTPGFVRFGSEVALDGNTLAVASLEPDQGAVHLFQHDGARWHEDSQVSASIPSQGSSFDEMALSGDDLVIGTPEDGSKDHASEDKQRGGVYVFRRGHHDAIPWDAGPGSPDAPAPPRRVIRVSAAGVRSPVTLTLEYGYGGNVDGSEDLAIAQDGTFAFETQLVDDTNYAVRMAGGDPPCVLRNQQGYMSIADVTVELQCSSLETLVVAGSLVTLAPETTEYTVDLLLSQETATVTATVARPGDTLVIAGAPVPSGTPSAPLALSLGDNTIDIVVENDLGWQRTYRLTVRRAAEIAQYAYAKASDPVRYGGFGAALAVSGDTLAVGAPGHDGNGLATGAVYVFRRSGTDWQQEALVQAADGRRRDLFGTSVALAGDTLAVGASGEASDATGIDGDPYDNSVDDNGAVYVFRRDDTGWHQEAYVKSSRVRYRQYFGARVALSGDTLAVIAVSPPQDPDSPPEGPRVPAVHMFRRGEAGWQAESVIDVGEDLALLSLALSGDTVAFGGAGDVHVYRRSGASWQHEANLASSCASGDAFGASVALSGETLAIGAPYEDSAATGVNGNPSGDGVPDSGAVYVYRRSGVSWLQEAYIKASNTGATDRFGRSVALSGELLAVGASGEDSAATGVNGDQADNSIMYGGAVYVFRRRDAAWQQTAYVKASNTDARDAFGDQVALSGDILAAGAAGDEFNFGGEDSAASGINGNHADNSLEGSGAAYVFHHLLE
jgi:hypothetical protein